VATRKPIRWLSKTTVKTPPFGAEAREAIGTLLRRVQEGENIAMPASRPMPVIGSRVHELRLKDHGERATWRIIYRTDSDAILVVSWYDKNTDQTPHSEIKLAQKRLREYDDE
jgi:phage-related protein